MVDGDVTERKLTDLSSLVMALLVMYSKNE